jgi:tetratricopeptide (TPR) repeat protein
MAAHPESVVAKTGRACVLAAMERWEEALELLPEKDVVTEQEWIGYHIRGMVLMGMGDLDGAIAIFEEGVRNNPRPADKDYFRTALAIARLGKHEDKLASGVLEEVSTPRLQTVSAILKMHAFGRQKDRARTAEIYETLPTKPGPVLAELVSELHWQYVAFKRPRHNEEWLIEKEIQYFLLAA